jgi:hypothetical protein
MSTTTSLTTTYILTTYRYQQDKPGVVRPTVPKDEWKIYQSNAPSSLHLTLEITKTASGSYTAVVMKIVDTDKTRPGGPTTLVKVHDLCPNTETDGFKTGNNRLPRLFRARGIQGSFSSEGSFGRQTSWLPVSPPSEIRCIFSGKRPLQAPVTVNEPSQN